jgi:hypothetical protein
MVQEGIPAFALRTPTARLALFCKTYIKDIDRFAQLAGSVRAFNEDHLPFLVSTPSRDAAAFGERFANEPILWITDEELVRGGLDDGWTQQQIVKFHVGHSGVADNYIMVDSDFYFIRPFATRHFLNGRGDPFLVMIDGARSRFFEAVYGGGQNGPITASVDHAYVHHAEWDALNALDTGHGIRRIQLLFCRDGPSYGFMPGPIWNAAVLASMETEFLIPAGLTFHDLIAISPWEYQWYGEWVLFRQPHSIQPIEPRFFGFVADPEIERARTLNISERFIAQYFLGIHMASNHQEILRLDGGGGD